MPRQGITLYSHLSRDCLATAPDEVWSTDIRYVPMVMVLLCLYAVLNLYISNMLDVGFCLQSLDAALRWPSAPYIFNSGQDS